MLQYLEEYKLFFSLAERKRVVRHYTVEEIQEEEEEEIEDVEESNYVGLAPGKGINFTSEEEEDHARECCSMKSLKLRVFQFIEDRPQGHLLLSQVMW